MMGHDAIEGFEMRLSSVTLAIAALAACPVAAPAADAGLKARDGRHYRAERPTETVRVVRETRRYGLATYQKPIARGVPMEQVAGERRRVYDLDGMPMTRSYVLSEAPRRIEKRVYVRDDERKPLALLYGGFYGSHRWGVGREGW